MCRFHNLASCVLFSWWRLCVVLASLNIFWPIAHIFGWIEYEICWTWHVMFAFTFAHVVMSAIQLVGVIANMAFLLVAGDLIGCRS